MRNGLSSGRASRSDSNAGTVSWRAAIERQHLPGHLGADGARVVVLLHMAVALEQVDDREVGRRLAIRHRGAFEHQPPWRVVGMDELIDQARLPHAGLPDEATTWPCPAPARSSACCSAVELLLPSHEAGEPPRRAGLQAPADRTGPDQLKDLHGLGQPLDRKLPQGIDLDQPFGQSEGRRGQPDTARRGELLHARRQVRGLAHGRVVHVQVVANRPHHDFPGVEPHAGLHLQPWDWRTSSA